MQQSPYTSDVGSINIKLLNAVITDTMISLVKDTINGSWQNAYTTEVNNAVEAQVKAIKEELERKSRIDMRLAELRFWIRMAGDSMSERAALRDAFAPSGSALHTWLSEKTAVDSKNQEEWWKEVNRIEEEESERRKAEEK